MRTHDDHDNHQHDTWLDVDDCVTLRSLPRRNGFLTHSTLPVLALGALAGALLAWSLLGCGRSREPDARELARDLLSADGTVRIRAALRLKKMGRSAAPALPELTSVLDHPGRDWDVSTQVVYTLGYIGPSAGDAVPGIARYLATSEKPMQHNAAARALGRIGVRAEVAVPALVRALDDGLTDRDVAAAALIDFGERALPALERVTQLLEGASSLDVEVAANLVGVLEAIGPNASAGVPILHRLLLDDTLGVDARMAAADALGAMGREARPALGSLESVLRTDAAGGSVEFRERAMKAIVRIKSDSE